MGPCLLLHSVVFFCIWTPLLLHFRIRNYMFDLTSDVVIDAFWMGNKTRYTDPLGLLGRSVLVTRRSEALNVCGIAYERAVAL